jgi:hypothetical protein
MLNWLRWHLGLACYRYPTRLGAWLLTGCRKP